MTATSVVWELTVYAPKSEDPTETTVLTPRAGSAHTEPFVVRTASGPAGTRPYLGIPKGRTGAIDAVTKRTTTGNLTLEVFDPRVAAGGSNAERWSTAFIGDTFGRPRLKGCRFVLKRSINGAAMAAYQTGRIRNVSTSRPLWLTLDVKDFADDLTRPIFTGAPHTSVSSYAAPSALLPLGVSQAWSNLAVTAGLSGTLTKRVAGANGAPDEGEIVLATPSSPADAMVTKALLDASKGDAPRIVKLTIVSTGATAYFRWPSTQEATKLAADGRTMVSGREYVINGGPVQHYGVQKFPVWTLPASDARFTAFPAGIGTGAAVTVRVFLDAPPSKAAPILISDVHPVQYWADLLDGKYSRTYDYDTLRPLAARDTSVGGPWATLLADPSFGLMREVVDQQWKGSDYIEKVICQRYNLAYYLDESGRVVPVDLRRSASLAGVPTLTDDDLVAEVEPSWDDSRDGAITAVVYDYQVDTRINAPDLVGSGDTYPDVPPSLVASEKSSVLIPNDLSTFRDVGEKIITIDARGTRVSSGDWLGAHFGRARLDRVRAELAQAGRDFLRPFGAGQLTATLTYRAASALAAAVRPGAYRIVNHTKLPNPSSNQRGGARLMLALSVNDVSPGRIAIQWLDAGEGAVAVSPVLSALTAASATAVDATIALNAASDPVDLWLAATDTSVAVRPADNAAEWVLAQTVTAAGTVRVTSLPGAKRIWARAQAHGAGANVKLPSGWAYPPAPGYVDLSAATAIDDGTAAGDNPPLGSGLDTVTPDVSIVLDSQTNISITAHVSASNPSGGTAPTMTFELIETSAQGIYIPGTVYAFSNPGVLIVDRPAFDPTTQAFLKLVVSISGGGSVERLITIPNQVKTSFGPSIDGNVSVSSTAATLTWTKVGTLSLKVDGVSTSVPTSPHIVTLDGSPHTYDFTAVLDGQTFTWSAFVPAVVDTTPPHGVFTSVSSSLLSAGADTVRFAWVWSGTTASFQVYSRENSDPFAYIADAAVGVLHYDYTSPNDLDGGAQISPSTFIDFFVRAIAPNGAVIAQSDVSHVRYGTT